LKYQNQPQNRDGESYRSKLEASRHAELKLLERASPHPLVRNIEREKTYRLEVNGHLVCKYLSDFTYEEWDGRVWRGVVEDCKGIITLEFRLKAKLMKACLGIDIRIVVSAGGASTKEYKRKIPTRKLPTGRKLRQ
jgi:hypothetical protein